MTTEYPSPSITISVLDHFVKVNADGIDRVSFTSEEMDINRIPVEFRVFFHRVNEHWTSTNMFVYRLDRDGFNPQSPATDGQKSKLYAALREACELLPADFLLDGQDAELGREIERLEIDIDRKKIEITDLVQKKRTLQIQIESALLR